MEKKKAPTISCITRKGGKRWLKSLTLTSITKWKQKLLIIDSITGEYTESTHFSQYDNGEGVHNFSTNHWMPKTIFNLSLNWNRYQSHMNDFHTFLPTSVTLEWLPHMLYPSSVTYDWFPLMFHPSSVTHEWFPDMFHPSIILEWFLTCFILHQSHLNDFLTYFLLLSPG